MTASTLYEAVEPHIIWKQFLNSIVSEIIGDGTQFEVRRLYLAAHLYPNIVYRQSG